MAIRAQPVPKYVQSSVSYKFLSKKFDLLPWGELILTPNHLCYISFMTDMSQSFDRLYNLKVHLRKHTGETPYQCPIGDCPKQFKWRSSMAHHVRAHHNGTNADITSVRVQGTGQTWMHTQQTSAFAAPAQIPSVTQSTPKVPSRSPGKSGRKKLGSAGMKPTLTIKKVTLKNDIKEKRMSVGNDPSSSGMKATATHENAMPAVAHATQEMRTRGADLDSIFDAFGDQMNDINVEIRNIIEPDSKLLSMVSDILAREEGTYEPELGQAMDTSIPDDPLECGMNFLAPGSDNATDAEMECLAHSDGALSTPDSNPSLSPVFKGFGVPPEVSELP